MSKINELKEKNIQLMRECFYDGQIYDKNTLSLKTGLAHSSITNILQLLIDEGEILYQGDGESTGGRKSKHYQINKDYRHIMMINLYKDNGQYVMSLKILDLLQNECRQEKMISSLGNMNDLDQLISRDLEKDKKIEIIVMSIPGVCDQGVIDICDFPEFVGLEMTKHIDKLYGKEAVLENDVNVACIGFSKDDQDVEHLAFVYQPRQDYVGCGMIIHHKLYNGFSHFAGELRYLPMYNHSMQDELLKSDPETLLKSQIVSLIAVMNPEVIAYCSDDSKIKEIELKDCGIQNNHLPQLVKVEDMSTYIEKGLYSIGINQLKRKR